MISFCMVGNNYKETSSQISTLYPDLTEGEFLEAEQKLAAYLKSTLELYDRIQADPERYPKSKEELARLRQSEEPAPRHLDL
jgi:hypothetical protein